MVPTKETPEEQLLRMIEGPGAASAPGGASRYGAVVQRVGEELRAGAEVLRQWLLPRPSAGARSDALLWRLRLAERLFWVVLAGLGVYLIVDLTLLPLKPPTLVPRIVSDEAASPETATAEQVKSLEAYRQALVSRNPFQLAIESIAEKAGRAPEQPPLEELTSNLVVVGINRGRVREALVEDREAQRTYVVQVGDQINELTVIAIDQRGVVLSDGKEEVFIQ